MTCQSSLTAPRFVAHGAAARGAEASRRPLWRRLLAALVASQERSFARFDARAIDDRTLRDIGLTRSDLMQAMSRPRPRRRS